MSQWELVAEKDINCDECTRCKKYLCNLYLLCYLSPSNARAHWYHQIARCIAISRLGCEAHRWCEAATYSGTLHNSSRGFRFRAACLTVTILFMSWEHQDCHDHSRIHDADFRVTEPVVLRGKNSKSLSGGISKKIFLFTHFSSASWLRVFTLQTTIQ